MKTPAITLLETLCASPEPDQSALPESVPPTSGALIKNADGVDLIDICWVARAVYGSDSPRWMQFRAWLLGDAPGWFRNLYIRHGERFARWIMPHPRVKSVIRRWMDLVIASR